MKIEKLHTFKFIVRLGYLALINHLFKKKRYKYTYFINRTIKNESVQICPLIYGGMERSLI